MVARDSAAWHVVEVFNSSLRYRRLRRSLGLSGLSVVILVLGSHASGRAAEGPFPGLPRHLDGSWAGIAQSGISEAAKARQWVQVPMQATAAFTTSHSIIYPQPDPLDRAATQVLTNYVYFVAPAGSEHNYGMSPKFTVRTVAFGAVPVEATLQLIQRRTADGLPAPIVATAPLTRFNNGPPENPGPARNTIDDTVIEDVVTLRVTRLVIDGVDLKLGGRCQTSEPGKLSLLGKGWRLDIDPVLTARPWETGNYVPGSGGRLTGTVDVPAFTGCLTPSGEDVSRLLTSTVSGPGNAVKLDVSEPGCARPIPPATAGNGPPRPGETTPEAAGCVRPGLTIPPLVPIP